jgi:hypothetical protein
LAPIGPERLLQVNPLEQTWFGRDALVHHANGINDMQLFLFELSSDGQAWYRTISRPCRTHVSQASDKKND